MMVKSFTLGFVTILFFVALSGCATYIKCSPAKLRAAKGTGLTRMYSSSTDQIWTALPGVLAGLKLKYIGEDKHKGYMLAEDEVAAYGTGDLIAIFVDSLNESTNSRVEVLAKQANTSVYVIGVTPIFSVSAEHWETEVLNKLDEKLKPTAARLK
jgi:hypothetical protein